MLRYVLRRFYPLLCIPVLAASSDQSIYAAPRQAYSGA